MIGLRTSACATNPCLPALSRDVTTVSTATRSPMKSVGAALRIVSDESPRDASPLIPNLKRKTHLPPTPNNSHPVKDL